MLVRINGYLEVKIETPLTVFKNKDRNHTMLNVADNLQAAHGIGAKGWLVSMNMCAWLNEQRVLRELANSKFCESYIENSSMHNLTEDLLEAVEHIRKRFHYFLANTTKLTQGWYALVIQMLRTGWCKRWDAYKLDLIRSNIWHENEKIPNRWKSFSLRMSAYSVRDVTNLHNKEGLSYERNAMILCGVGRDVSRKCDEGHLKP